MSIETQGPEKTIHDASYAELAEMSSPIKNIEIL